MSITAALEPEAPVRLPPLRNDLRLGEGPTLSDGSPSWTIQDPVSNTFYRIGWLEFELLSRWSLGRADHVLAATAAQTPLSPSPAELDALLNFLQQHQLLDIHSPQHTQTLIGLARRSRMGAARWLLHHYLFFRIPLWHPAQWLERQLPRVAWLYRPATAAILGALTLLGLVLTWRQVDVFTSSLVDTFTPGGLVAYLIALALTKSLHELGHAFTATRYGVRVAHMGVAFLVMWPMLYTDTGEAWRLKRSRERLAIASAGIVTELAIAGLATLAWNLAPPGDLRQALFFLATTAWVMSLAINASPFMRFDGYFILSDLLDMPNLHERAFAQGRAWLRRVLLGWPEVVDEAFPPWQRRALVAFAVAVWIYRLALFLGIAVLVYHYFFKALGIVLFAVEIGWFVVRPIMNELKLWRERHEHILPARKRLGWILLALLMALLLLPFDRHVRAPAWSHSAQSQVIYSPFAARIVAVEARAGEVAADQVLFRLDSPDASLRTRIAQTQEAALDKQLAGLAALPDGEARRATLLEQRAMRSAEATAGTDEQHRLILAAPFAGQLSDVDPQLAAGVWVSPEQPLGVVWTADAWIVDAFVGEADLARLSTGSRVRFYPEDAPLVALDGQIEQIDTHHIKHLPDAMLSTRHGGPITTLDHHEKLVPAASLYRVRIRLDAPPPNAAMQRGRVVADARSEALAKGLFNGVVALLIRETGF